MKFDQIVPPLKLVTTFFIILGFNGIVLLQLEQNLATHCSLKGLIQGLQSPRTVECVVNQLALSTLALSIIMYRKSILSMSIYDLVLKYVCHFHHYHLIVSQI